MSLIHPMPAQILTIQYLEDSPDLLLLDRATVINCLRSAAELLPFTHLLIGWHVPVPLLEACRLEAEDLGLRFLRWQPLLTSDQDTYPDPAWLTEGLSGRKVAGYQGMPAFTFSCPNHPAVQEAVYGHLEALIRQGFYQGFFLDRVRFPSPTTDPLNELTCFCEHCRRKAASAGLDLPEIRAALQRQTQTEKGRLALVKTLLGIQPDLEDEGMADFLSPFLSFRQKSIRDFLAVMAQPLREAHLEIGLDCYSPSLTNLVGQDLSLLSEQADWIKLMTYAHTNAPAGIPYELSGLVRYLLTAANVGERDILEIFERAVRVPLPASLDSLEKDGLSSLALEQEVRRGVESSSVPILAGLELVDLPGVVDLYPGQIQADLMAVRRAQPAGLAISWDLLHIPSGRLALVNQVYLG